MADQRSAIEILHDLEIQQVELAGDVALLSAEVDRIATEGARAIVVLEGADGKNGLKSRVAVNETRITQIAADIAAIKVASETTATTIARLGRSRGGGKQGSKRELAKKAGRWSFDAAAVTTMLQTPVVKTALKWFAMKLGIPTE